MAKFPSYTDAYDYPPHLKHVEMGFCDSIHRSKVWCDRPFGHDGYHRAPKLPSGEVRWDAKNELKKRTNR